MREGGCQERQGEVPLNEHLVQIADQPPHICMLQGTRACRALQHLRACLEQFPLMFQVDVIGCEDDSRSAIGDAISRFADLIVASRHSKSAITQLFLGSTTARLAKSSVVPLTILP